MFKIFCFFGLHNYDINVELGIYDMKKGMPFHMIDKCKRCGKIKAELKGYIEEKKKNDKRIYGKENDTKETRKG